MATAYRVTVYDRNIVSLIQVGSGNRWVRSQAKQIEMMARVMAPKRTGRLAASHVTLPTRGSNQYHKVYRISAQAYYAAWVYNGTGIYGPMHRPVTSRSGKLMVLPGANPRPKWGIQHNSPGKPTMVFSHKGQKPNHWLELAARAVL